MKQDEILVTKNVSEIREVSKKRKRSKGFIVGVIINILAIIGVVTILVLSFNVVKNMFSNEKEKQRWADYVLPVAMLPLQDFEKLEDVPLNDIRLSAVWASLLHLDLDTLDRDLETDYLVVPESEVSKQAAILYGKDYFLEHADVEVSAIQMYLYDSEAKAYLVSDTEGSQNAPTAMVKDIARVEEGIQLTVGSLPAPAPWELNPDGSRHRAVPERYFYYIVSSDKDPQIIAIRTAHDLNEELQKPIDGTQITPEQETTSTNDIG